MDLIAGSFSTFPSFVAYFLSGGFLLTAFVLLYVYSTPYPEFALIRSGNTAAALVMGGALLGFVIPLSSVIANSGSLVDLLLWGGIALIIQLLGLWIAKRVIPGLSDAIRAGTISDAIFVASLSLALGILDAACMVG